MYCDDDVLECSWYNPFCWATCSQFTDIEYCGFCGVDLPCSADQAGLDAFKEAMENLN